MDFSTGHVNKESVLCFSFKKWFHFSPKSLSPILAQSLHYSLKIKLLDRRENQHVLVNDRNIADCLMEIVLSFGA